jgi:uncharacterized protein YfaS (alpha-2-macroglobulin family)
VSFSDTVVPGTNLVRMDVTGTGNLAYQIHTSYYLPWPKPGEGAMTPTVPLTLEVRYEPARLRVGETTQVKVNLGLREGNIAWGIVELVIPPGFEADPDELDRLLAQHRDPPPGYTGARITRIDREPDRIVVYFEGLEAGQPLGFSYSLWARSPVKLRTLPGRAYDYYNPEISAEAASVEIEVVR